jgi:hypothetical protein
MRWAIGAIAAAFCATVLLPGVASAHHVDLDKTFSCEDGTFQIDADYTGGDGNRVIIIKVDGDQYDGNPNDFAGMTATTNSDVDNPDNTPDDEDFNFSTDRDRFEIDGHPNNTEEGIDETDSNPNFFVLQGGFDAVDAQPDDSVDVESKMYEANSDSVLDNALVNDDFENDGNTSSDLVDTDNKSITVLDYEECIITVCTDGDHVSDYEFEQGADTGDCDPVRVCVDGQNFVVTEFEQQEGDLQVGDCIPFEETPPPPTTTTITTTTTLPPAAPVEPEAEVLPAALPATGMGPGETSSGFSWGAAAAVVLLGLGGGTALLARRRVS